MEPWELYAQTERNFYSRIPENKSEKELNYLIRGITMYVYHWLVDDNLMKVYFNQTIEGDVLLCIDTLIH
jgi:hypothetical protein